MLFLCQMFFTKGAFHVKFPKVSGQCKMPNVQLEGKNYWHELSADAY